MKKREDRRDRTLRAAQRIYREHVRWVHRFDGVECIGTCICEESVRYFAKRKAVGCDCRGRKHGQPKLGTGTCHGLDTRPSLIERRNGRKIERGWVVGLRHLDADDIDL